MFGNRKKKSTTVSAAPLPLLAALQFPIHIPTVSSSATSQTNWRRQTEQINAKQFPTTTATATATTAATTTTTSTTKLSAVIK